MAFGSFIQKDVITKITDLLLICDGFSIVITNINTEIFIIPYKTYKYLFILVVLCISSDLMSQIKLINRIEFELKDGYKNEKSIILRQNVL